MPAVLSAESSAYLAYRPAVAVYRRAIAADRPFPEIGATGTGGMARAVYFLTKQGYSTFEVVLPLENKDHQAFAQLMQVIKQGFDRTFSHLPSVFGVSRQTLYNWAAGETPKEAHQAKLTQLAAAAEVFLADGFKPTGTSLNRTIRGGKNFLELIALGTDGAVAAHQLIRIQQRGTVSKAQLNAVLGDRKAKLIEADGDY